MRKMNTEGQALLGLEHGGLRERIDSLCDDVSNQLNRPARRIRATGILLDADSQHAMYILDSGGAQNWTSKPKRYGIARDSEILRQLFQLSRTSACG